MRPDASDDKLPLPVALRPEAQQITLAEVETLYRIATDPNATEGVLSPERRRAIQRRRIPEITPEARQFVAEHGLRDELRKVLGSLGRYYQIAGTIEVSLQHDPEEPVTRVIVDVPVVGDYKAVSQATWRRHRDAVESRGDERWASLPSIVVLTDIVSEG